MMRDLQCEPGSVEGPPDPRAVAYLQSRFALSDDVIAQLAARHGGVPQINTWTGNDLTVRIARFLTLYGLRSQIPGPAIPHWQDRTFDVRHIASISYLADGGHQTQRALFGELVPFASLKDGHSWDLTHSSVDLVCLDCRQAGDPGVVLWRSDPATSAQIDFEVSQTEAGDDVPWHAFIVPLADSLGEFIEALEPES